MLYTGTVEDRQDPLKLGRCRVRIIGLHTQDKVKLPTQDLPWAYPMQPITSAAMSGIGSTPLGLVEGTWVVVMFQDEENQYPIILGSIGGIPQKDELLQSDDSTLQIKIGIEQAKTNGQVVLDGSGNPIMTGAGVPLTTSQPALTNTNSLRKASQFTPSQDCIDIIKRYEGLRLRAYQDSAGIWTIGYGTTRINDQPVQPGLSITREQAEGYLAEDLKTQGSTPVANSVRALITQSMFDALCSFTYNVGSGNLRKSTLLKDLNSEKYNDAAAGFSMWNRAGGQVLPGLTNRRIAERDLFLKEGIPNQFAELPSQSQPTQASTQTNSVSSDSGTTATQSTVSSQGFKDPNAKYPLYFNEPDTNRLARHEEIQNTIVYKKEAALDKEVQTAGGVTWSQPPIPYNAQYPFNHVMQTESGHVLEFDDSPQSERIHIYHKAGTFSEIDANGTRVNRIVGDDYEILERNGYVHINGNLNVTVDGSKNVLVKNTLNLDVTGVANVNVFNDVNLKVSGNLNASVRESFKLKAASVFIEGESVDIKSIAGPIRVDASQNLELKSSTKANLEGPTVHFAEGAASAVSTGLSYPDSIKTTEAPEFNQLTVINRYTTAAIQYETPDDGDSTAFKQQQIISGAMDPLEFDYGVPSPPEKVEKNEVSPPSDSCAVIRSKSTFEPSFKLSQNYRLADLTKNGSRMPVPQFGLSTQEIVCNLKGLCENVLEPVRSMHPNIIITSGFRRPGDVAASAKKSDHYLGSAVDIQIPGYTRQQYYDAIKDIQKMIPYDQLILEYAGVSTVWIHASFKYNGARKQAFTMRDHKKVSQFGEFVLIV